MAKIARKKAQIFADSASAGEYGIAQFGSLAANNPTFSKDPDVIQALPAYANGWHSATVADQSPAMEDRNAIDYLNSRQIAYLLEQGIPEWLSTQTYYKNAYVVDGNGDLRKSLIDNNTGNDPVLDTDKTKWGAVASEGGGRSIGEIVPSTLPLTDAGLHLLDGSLLSGSGTYADFVTYMAGLYADNPAAPYFAQQTNTPFVQPVLSSNGTLGGNSFACAVDKHYDTMDAWCMFDNNISTAWNTWGTSNPLQANITIYNPTPIKITSVFITNGQHQTRNFNISSITVSGSDDNSTWTAISSTLTNNSNYQQTLTLDNNAFYKYYKFYCNGSVDGDNFAVYSMDITATENTYITAEQAWQNEVTAYGVCGKFVYDSVNNTVRLPKITGFIQGTNTLSELTELVEESLPNITGTIGRTFASENSGAFYTVNTTSSAQGGSGGGTLQGFDASRSSSVYKENAKVQPQSIKVYFYIVIANSVKTAIQADIDQIATDLNGKADTDLTNIANTGKSTISNLPMPSDTSITLTPGPSGTSYTAPADGFFRVTFNTSSSPWFIIYGKGIASYWQVYPNSTGYKTWIPVAKGQDCSVEFGNCTITEIRFTYSKGSEHEAN